MTQEFVDQWMQAHPNDTVTYRDVGRYPVPHVDEAWIAAAYAPEVSPALQQGIQVSDQLVDEFLSADLYVFGIPMYNFSIPSTFKAYIDQIVRPGRTFSLAPEKTENRYQPLVLGKQMVIILID
jgi:FMN-dependent NADH-azoreductase